MKNITPLLVFVLLLLSCSQELGDYRIVYFNDFEDENLEQIFNGNITTFQADKVIGNYNNSGFTLILNDLPKHQLINVRVHLYIHDSWDGNAPEPNGPDVWGFGINDWAKYRRKSSEQKVFETSFSNERICNETLCSRQSFPNAFPSIFQPRTGASNFEYRGVCHLKNNSNGSSLYLIEKVYPNEGSSVAIRFYDHLVQNNSTEPFCDESWSIGEIEIGVW